MSWDCTLTNKETGKPIELGENHQLKGGMYALGGTEVLELNVTYNYSETLVRVLGGEGLRDLYDKTGLEAVTWLTEGASKLTGEPTEDYWEASDGNVRKALLDLAELSAMAPNGVWEIT